jgi:ribosomal protein L22
MTEKNLNEPMSKVPEIKEKKMKNIPSAIAVPEKKESSETKETKAEEKNNEVKIEEKTKEAKSEKKKAEPKVKKTEAMVYGRNLPVSLKHSIAIGKFIKYKKINEAIKNLEKVLNKKLAVPFTGEIPHRKRGHMLTKSMPSGRYPKNASKEFIRVLKALSANSNANGMDLEKTIVSEVIINKAPSQKHRFGNTEFKRAHVLIRAKEITERKKEKAAKEKIGGKK